MRGLIWFIWSIWSVWFNQTNETNQINKRDQPVLALHGSTGSPSRAASRDASRSVTRGLPSGLTLDEEGGGLCAAGDLQFLKHVGEIVLDRLIAELHRGRNFLVG